MRLRANVSDNMSLSNERSIDRINAALVATQALQNLAVYEKATSISVFLSMPGAELQTTGIVEHALRSGKRVFVPYITRKPPVMEMLQLENEHDFKSLKPDKWGIPSLDAASIEARTNCFGHKGVNSTASSQSPERGLDLILMPAVAFDQSFDRLGHGKGYYDRFLTRYKAKIDQDCSSLRQPYLSKSS